MSLIVFQLYSKFAMIRAKINQKSKCKNQNYGSRILLFERGAKSKGENY